MLEIKIIVLGKIKRTIYRLGGYKTNKLLVIKMIEGQHKLSVTK